MNNLTQEQRLEQVIYTSFWISQVKKLAEKWNARLVIGPEAINYFLTNTDHDKS